MIVLRQICPVLRFLALSALIGSPMLLIGSIGSTTWMLMSIVVALILGATYRYWESIFVSLFAATAAVWATNAILPRLNIIHGKMFDGKPLITVFLSWLASTLIIYGSLLLIGFIGWKKIRP